MNSSAKLNFTKPHYREIPLVSALGGNVKQVGVLITEVIEPRPSFPNQEKHLLLQYSHSINNVELVTITPESKLESINLLFQNNSLPVLQNWFETIKLEKQHMALFLLTIIGSLWEVIDEKPIFKEYLERASLVLTDHDEFLPQLLKIYKSSPQVQEKSRQYLTDINGYEVLLNLCTKILPKE